MRAGVLLAIKTWSRSVTYIYNTYMEEGCFGDVQDFEKVIYNLNVFIFWIRSRAGCGSRGSDLLVQFHPRTSKEFHHANRNQVRVNGLQRPIYLHKLRAIDADNPLQVLILIHRFPAFRRSRNVNQLAYRRNNHHITNVGWSQHMPIVNPQVLRQDSRRDVKFSNVLNLSDSNWYESYPFMRRLSVSRSQTSFIC